MAALGLLRLPNGDSDELTSQASLARLGAVSAKGGQGMDWLAVESSSQYDLDTLTIQRHVRSLIPGSTDKMSEYFRQCKWNCRINHAAPYRTS